MSAHTPGPWVVCLEDDMTVPHTVFAADRLVNDRVEAAVWDFSVATAGLNDENCEANARLIAAAPELLTWLRWSLKHLSDDKKQSAQYDWACAVLLKAGGEKL